MMAMFGSARERTKSGFAELFRDAGLALAQVIETNSPVFILEAVPA